MKPNNFLAGIKKPWMPYVCPFAIFMLFTGLGQYFPSMSYHFYVIKTVLVAALLLYFRKDYQQDLSGYFNLRIWLESILAAIIVLGIWILPENLLPTIGTPSGFNPTAFGLSWPSETVVLAIRLLGAAIVVPIMEELFWRSFLMRYLIHPNFQAVRLGAFSWFSFLSVTFLFGLEHYRIIQGIIAGAIFSLLVIRQKSLKGAIISHGVTNLGLGIYVMSTGSWHFW